MQKKVYKSKFGRLEMRVDSPLLVAKFTGSVTEAMVDYFIRELPNAVSYLPEQWGYVSWSGNAEAATPSAHNKLVEAAIKCHQLGCVQAGYVLTSVVAKAQTASMRAKLGVTEPIESVTFEHYDEAKQFVLERLHVASQ